MQGYIDLEKPHCGLATEILRQWQGEFERMRRGEFGSAAKQTADGIVDHLMFIDLTKIGRFKMGTSTRRSGFHSLPIAQQNHWKELFQTFRTDTSKIKDWFDNRYLSTKAIQEWREKLEIRWVRLAQSADSKTAFVEFSNDLYPPNEVEITYANLPNEQFSNFSIVRHSVSNSFFRLFDPGHGLRISFRRSSDDDINDLWPNYFVILKDEETPALFLSYFDAWCYSRFLHWAEQTCHLPFEDQWECAAKYGFGWDHWQQAFWWGDTFDPIRDRMRINCAETEFGKTLKPDPERANPETKKADPKGLGLMDLRGGVWEWCEDPFVDMRMVYRRCQSLLTMDANVPRSVRGGSFLSFAFHARCSYRNHFDPTNASRYVGCRIARAETRNS